MFHSKLPFEDNKYYTYTIYCVKQFILFWAKFLSLEFYRLFFSSYYIKSDFCKQICVIGLHSWDDFTDFIDSLLSLCFFRQKSICFVFQQFH